LSINPENVSILDFLFLFFRTTINGKTLPLMVDSRLWQPAKNPPLALQLIVAIIGVAAYGSRHKKCRVI